MKKPKDDDKVRCEVCGQTVSDNGYRSGCEQCARLFGNCCNSVQDGVCVECVE